MQKITAVFENNRYIIGNRGLKQRIKESAQTHHMIVTDASDKSLIGREVAIHILKPLYWIINE